MTGAPRARGAPRRSRLSRSAGAHAEGERAAARVLPLMHAHVRVLGRYHLRLDDSVERGGLRPLRDPDANDEFGLHMGL